MRRRWLPGLIVSALLHAALAMLVLRTLGETPMLPPLLVDLARVNGDAPPGVTVPAASPPVAARSRTVPRRPPPAPPAPPPPERPPQDVPAARSPAAPAPDEPRAMGVERASAAAAPESLPPLEATAQSAPVPAGGPVLALPSPSETKSLDTGVAATAVTGGASPPGSISGRRPVSAAAGGAGSATAGAPSPGGPGGATATDAGLADGRPGDEMASAGTNPASAADDYRMYIRHLRSILEKSIEYPRTARRRGISGTVEVDIVVEPTGRVRAVEIVTRAHPVLEDAALEAVQRLRPEPIPAGLPRRPLRVRLPLVFALEPER